MSGIPGYMLLSVNRVRTTFEDDVGNRQAGTGTGFWVSHSVGEQEELGTSFVTNRHNLDGDMLWPSKGFRLVKSEIEVRQFGERTADEEEDDDEFAHPLPETMFIDVPTTCWRLHGTADCAAAISPSLPALAPGFQPYAFLFADFEIANEFWIAANVTAMDFASFIGFPRSGSKAWWDEKWNLPIARLASLATPPSLEFTNAAIKTANVGLVSGLSFGGSSGSPLLLHEKGLKIGHMVRQLQPDPRGRQTGVIDDSSTLRRSKLIGIMSGHFREDAHLPEMIRHTGLSYYTRSPAILEVLGLDPSGFGE